MIWYKSWLETRWRFLIGLALLLCSAAGSVLVYPEVLRLLPALPVNLTGELGRRVREAADLARSFRGYVWSNWFRQNLSHGVTLFAALLGTAGLLSNSGGTLFTLSLPLSRRRLLAVRAATGLAELFILTIVPSLLLPVLASAVGASYSVADALIHSLCAFVAASLFFCLAFLLSTVFDDPWRPLLIALGVALLVLIVDQVSSNYSVFRVMSGETWFRSGRLPWSGLLATASLSALLCGGAVVNFARRDY